MSAFKSYPSCDRRHFWAQIGSNAEEGDVYNYDSKGSLKDDEELLNPNLLQLEEQDDWIQQQQAKDSLNNYMPPVGEGFGGSGTLLKVKKASSNISNDPKTPGIANIISSGSAVSPTPGNPETASNKDEIIDQKPTKKVNLGLKATLSKNLVDNKAMSKDSQIPLEADNTKQLNVESKTQDIPKEIEDSLNTFPDADTKPMKSLSQTRIDSILDDELSIQSEQLMRLSSDIKKSDTRSETTSVDDYVVSPLEGYGELVEKESAIPDDLSFNSRSIDAVLDENDLFNDAVKLIDTTAAVPPSIPKPLQTSLFSTAAKEERENQGAIEPRRRAITYPDAREISNNLVRAFSPNVPVKKLTSLERETLLETASVELTRSVVTTGKMALFAVEAVLDAVSEQEVGESAKEVFRSIQALGKIAGQRSNIANDVATSEQVKKGLLSTLSATGDFFNTIIKKAAESKSSRNVAAAAEETTRCLSTSAFAATIWGAKQASHVFNIISKSIEEKNELQRKEMSGNKNKASFSRDSSQVLELLEAEDVYFAVEVEDKNKTLPDPKDVYFAVEMSEKNDALPEVKGVNFSATIKPRNNTDAIAELDAEFAAEMALIEEEKQAFDENLYEQALQAARKKALEERNLIVAEYLNKMKKVDLDLATMKQKFSKEDGTREPKPTNYFMDPPRE